MSLGLEGALKSSPGNAKGTQDAVWKQCPCVLNMKLNNFARYFTGLEETQGNSAAAVFQQHIICI